MTERWAEPGSGDSPRPIRKLESTDFCRLQVAQLLNMHRACPFTEPPIQFESEVDVGVHDYPSIKTDDQSLTGFLHKHIYPEATSHVNHRLWWISNHSEASISTLSRQKAKYREIMITENPNLHLCWDKGRIFIQPMPIYLLSATFWDRHLGHDSKLRCSTLGYLRTWRYLIEHKSDFRIALKLDLIPEEITWIKLSSLLAELEWIDNTHVIERYEYGEIRLMRLDILLRLCFRPPALRKSTLYSTYSESQYSQLVYSFAMITVNMGALQAYYTIDVLSPYLSLLRGLVLD